MFFLLFLTLVLVAFVFVGVVGEVIDLGGKICTLVYSMRVDPQCVVGECMNYVEKKQEAHIRKSDGGMTNPTLAQLVYSYILLRGTIVNRTKYCW